MKEIQRGGQRVAHKGSHEVFNYAELTVCFDCSFSTMLCRRAEWGGVSWFGSGLFENIQAVARKRVKAEFHKTLFVKLNWPGAGRPCGFSLVACL